MKVVMVHTISRFGTLGGTVGAKLVEETRTFKLTVRVGDRSVEHRSADLVAIIKDALNVDVVHWAWSTEAEEDDPGRSSTTAGIGSPGKGVQIPERWSKPQKMLVQCELLDREGVPNGTKAIAIALARLWTGEHRATLGEHDNAATIRRWRSERGQRGYRTIADMKPVRRTHDRRSMPLGVRQLRWRHATRVFASGQSMIDGYASALKELRDSTGEGSSSSPLPSFSYATFCRDCRKAAASSRRYRPAAEAVKTNKPRRRRGARRA